MPAETAAVTLLLTPELLTPLVREIVGEVVLALQSDRAKVNCRLADSEAEAAALIGLQVYQLRDERLRGRIGASQIVGKRICYTPADLERYLLERRWKAAQQS